MHRKSVYLFSAVIVALGLAMVVRTLTAGGGPTSIGLIMGILFVALGIGRLYLLRKQ